MGLAVVFFLAAYLGSHFRIREALRFFSDAAVDNGFWCVTLGLFWLSKDILAHPHLELVLTDRPGAKAIAQSLVQWSACRQELGITSEQLANYQQQVKELETIVDSWQEQHDSALHFATTAQEELKIREQLEENLRQRLGAQQIHAEKAEGKLFWKQVEKFLQGAVVGGIIGLIAK